jgi:hypothetical protein
MGIQNVTPERVGSNLLDPKCSNYELRFSLLAYPKTARKLGDLYPARSVIVDKAQGGGKLGQTRSGKDDVT